MLFIFNSPLLLFFLFNSILGSSDLFQLTLHSDAVCFEFGGADIGEGHGGDWAATPPLPFYEKLKCRKWRTATTCNLCVWKFLMNYDSSWIVGERMGEGFQACVVDVA